MKKTKKPKRSKHVPPNLAWTPFQRIDIPEKLVEEFAKQDTLPPQALYRNSKYQVTIYGTPTIIHLSVYRNDGREARDWEDLQRIKNELVSPEAEAVELFPAESRKESMGGHFHLWVLPDEQMWPIGYGMPKAIAERAEALLAEKEDDESDRAD